MIRFLNTAKSGIIEESAHDHPTTETVPGRDLLDPDEPGISEDEARRRRIVRNQPLIALIDEWIAEAEIAMEEERRIAEEEWEQFFREFEPLRLREYHHEP